MDLVFSTNRRFAIDRNEPHILYAVRGVIDHPWIKQCKSTNPITNAGVTLYPHCYTRKFKINDCLQFAESLAIGVVGYDAEACIFKEKSSQLEFGDSDEVNIQIAKKLGSPLNENANPNIGEAYAIVRKKIVNNKAPFHIAFVLFKDGSTNITLEADAGQELETPVFDMYSTVDPANSFHAREKKGFAPASTVVLTKKTM